mgnify:CR=1 FL=1
MSKQRPDAWLLTSFLLLLLVSSALYGKAYLQARSTYQKAERFLQKGQLRKAIRSYAYTIRWYTPSNPYGRVAIDRLNKIGEQTYKRGNWSLALSTYQQLCGSLSAIRNIYQPYASKLEQCHKQLVTLITLLPSINNTQSQNDIKLSNQLLKQLQYPLQPNATYVYLGVFLFGFWIFLLMYSFRIWPSTNPRQRLSILMGLSGVWLLTLLSFTVA